MLLCVTYFYKNYYYLILYKLLILNCNRILSYIGLLDKDNIEHVLYLFHNYIFYLLY